MANGKEDGKTKQADMMAGEGSFLDKLRKRRRAIDEGDASGGDAFSPTDSDHKRGYTKEPWE